MQIKGTLLTLSIVWLAALASSHPPAPAPRGELVIRGSSNTTRSNKKTTELLKPGPPKYFREASFHPHYDRRFADRVLSYVDQKQALKNLLQTYLATLSDLGVETWLMHGSLLGWWWNKQIMPWDSDVDVQISEASMYYLAAYYNMSVFHYKTPRIAGGRDYLLDINPAHTFREQTDKFNKIDARWIDTKTGLFIDITSPRYNLTHPEGEGMMSCKDGHEFRDTYIFPLRDSTFENAPVKIPYRYRELLASEYSERALTNKDFKGHIFNEDRMEWIPKKQAPKPQQEPGRQGVQAQKPQQTPQQASQQTPQQQRQQQQKSLHPQPHPAHLALMELQLTRKQLKIRERQEKAYRKHEDKRKKGEWDAMKQERAREDAFEKGRLQKMKEEGAAVLAKAWAAMDRPGATGTAAPVDATDSAHMGEDEPGRMKSKASGSRSVALKARDSS